MTPARGESRAVGTSTRSPGIRDRLCVIALCGCVWVWGGGVGWGVGGGGGCGVCGGAGV
jgi:hypothetical protein